MTAAIAGCIGGDDDPDPGTNGDDGNDGNGGGNETDNQTVDPPAVPAASMSVAMSIDGAAHDAPFIVEPGTQVEFTLDGGNSTVDNGTIDIYSWSVFRPNGRTEQSSGTNATYSFGINETTNTGDYGVYTAVLRVMSDQGQVSEAATIQFALSYKVQLSFDHTLVGPGALGCDGYEMQGGSATEGYVVGTYLRHIVKVGENATTVNLSLDFASETGANMQLLLYEPDVSIDDCGDALNSGDASASPTLSTTDLTAVGSYPIRVQLVGIDAGPYTMDVEVLYEVPEGGEDDSEDDGGDE